MGRADASLPGFARDGPADRGRPRQRAARAACSPGRAVAQS